MTHGITTPFPVGGATYWGIATNNCECLETQLDTLDPLCLATLHMMVRFDSHND